MEYQKIIELISRNEDIAEFAPFGEGVTDQWIARAEKRLNVLFPPSYIWWLKNYGGGEIYGDEIYSIYEQDFDYVVGGDIVYVNELNRKNNLATNDQLIIHKNDQAEVYYFRLDEKDSDGEYPVYMDPGGQIYASNFVEFLRQKIG